MDQEQKKVLTVQGAPATAPSCTHHWVIETPAGPVSYGRCKLCNEEREFRNYLENTPYWEDDTYLDQVSSGARFRTSEPAVESSAEGTEE